jgi:hypothetical protein
MPQMGAVLTRVQLPAPPPQTKARHERALVLPGGCCLAAVGSATGGLGWAPPGPASLPGEPRRGAQ